LSLSRIYIAVLDFLANRLKALVARQGPFCLWQLSRVRQIFAPAKSAFPPSLAVPSLVRPIEKQLGPLKAPEGAKRQRSVLSLSRIYIALLDVFENRLIDGV
jgi:hypothetical protein